jgi:site-specific DNA recombinase
MGGKPFTKTSLHKLLTNATYAGKLRYKTELHNGERPILVATDSVGRTTTRKNSF